MPSHDWEQIGVAKRQQLLDSIPPQFRIPDDLLPPDSQLEVLNWGRDNGFFTKEELAITDSTAEELLTQIASQLYTSEQVTSAFLKKAAAAHQLTKCLTLFFWGEALSTARSLDAHLKSTGKPVGPLHGLPISLKDNFNLKGKPSTVGFTAWANDPADYDSILVEVLRDQGAVFYCKTNVPTAMMIAETVNNLFDRTVNPLNRNFTSGGSSGGESALIAFGGSPLGVGTDIGGSLRIPASATGIYTLRPSFGRFPTLQARSGLAGQEAVNSVNGPMSCSLRTLSLFAQAVVGAQPWRHDPKMLPIPWRDASISGRKLKLAVLWSDGIVAPTPPVQRALRQSVERLQAKGHELVEWHPTLHADLLRMLMAFFTADGGSSVRGILEQTGEPWRPEMQGYASARDLPVSDLWRLQGERTGLQKRFLDQWRGMTGLDGILAPTSPYASARNGSWRYVGYTGVFNVVDYAATSFPTPFRVEKEKDVWEEGGYKALSETDQQVRDEYDAEAAHGLPISLQLIAGRLEEEKVLEMTRIVVEDLAA